MFTKRNLIVLFGKHAIVAIASVVITIIVVWVLLGEIARISDSVLKNRQLADKLSHRTELFSVLARDADIVGTNDVVIEHAFVPADNILGFVSALENVSIKNNTIPSFHFSTPVASSIPAPFPISSIEYQNSASLDVYALMAYLKDFESLPYFTKINSLSFTSQGSTGWRGPGSVSFNATLYTKASQ